MKRAHPLNSAPFTPSKRQHPVAATTTSATSTTLTLIDIDGADMKLNPEAKAILQAGSTSSSSRPLATICVVGRSRTGKSFLLNRGLLNKGDAFQVSPSTRACTKGLWIAGKPIPAKEFWANLDIVIPAAEDTYDVLVIDTEGINALDRDQTYDMRIFTLALLLSSVFVYNSLGAIDENAISTLSAVASVAESLKKENRVGRGGGAGAGAGAGSSSSSSSLELPSLLWVVRDFALDIEREGDEADEREQLSDDEYLEEALKVDGIDPRSTKAQLRKVLMDAFPKRACQTMVRPADREEEMKRLQDLADEELRPEFVGQMKQLRSKLHALAVHKRVAGRAVDASLFADLIEHYLVSINNNRVPAVADAWTQVTRQRCERGVSQAVAYIENLTSGGGGAAAGAGGGVPAGSVGGVSSSGGSASSSILIHPTLVHEHIAYGLRTAERVYRSAIVGIPDTYEFDRQLQQRLLIAVSSAAHMGGEASARAMAKIVDAAAASLKDAPPVAVTSTSTPSSMLSAWLERWIRVLEETVRKGIPTHPLPEHDYSSDIIPHMIEDASRKEAVAATSDRWNWLLLRKLASSPDLLATYGLGLPAAGVPPEEHDALKKELANRKSEVESLEGELAEMRAKWKEALMAAEQANNELQLRSEELEGVRCEMASVVAAHGQSAEMDVELLVRARVGEVEGRLNAKHRRAQQDYEAELDSKQEEIEEQSRQIGVREEKIAALQAQIAEGEARLMDVRAHKDILTNRCQALEGEIAKTRDKMAARMAELQKLTEEHAAQRLEWATRLRDSETQSAKAQGVAESLAARVKTMEQSIAQLEGVRAKLHETQLTLARCETEKRMVEEEKKRVQAELSEKEDVLFEGLRAVRELQRQAKR